MTTAPSDTARERIEAFLAEPRNVMVAGLSRDGRPHVTPNWFHWDGTRFYISTTKKRQKYRNFRRDPRVQLVVDDSTAFRTIMLDGTVEIWDDLDRALPYFRKIREKHGRPPASDEALREQLTHEERVLLAITPDKPVESWTHWGM